jgi:hypothetical protein
MVLDQAMGIRTIIFLMVLDQAVGLGTIIFLMALDQAVGLGTTSFRMVLEGVKAESITIIRLATLFALMNSKKNLKRGVVTTTVRPNSRVLTISLTPEKKWRR